MIRLHVSDAHARESQDHNTGLSFDWQSNIHESKLRVTISYTLESRRSATNRTSQPSQ
jgi:hypothetical protein